MRIFYRYGKLSIPLWLPNSIIKLKKIQKKLKIEEYKDLIEITLKECKKYVRKYGHFTIVNITTADDENKIVIKIKI